ncbi:hypothetical protein [Nostoc sp.]|uniref:hypothetical protein n=1 Tax=Nostoc sp. TaxID=1180 RepID=UPI002FFD0545
MLKFNTRALRKTISKPRKKAGNPDFRHRVTVPASTSEQIESRLIALVSPGTFANLKGIKDFERELARCLRRATPTQNLLLQLIPWLVEHQRSMGLVKAIRQRYRRNAARSLDIWAEALTDTYGESPTPQEVVEYFFICQSLTEPDCIANLNHS